MKRTSFTTLLTMLLLTAPIVLIAQEQSDMLDILSRESTQITSFTLPNGLHVILKPDHTAPVATVQFWIGTGSIHEEQFTGAGISHAVEHMIFKGTPDLPVGDLSRRIQEAGGRINAYTTLDRTVYFADLPANQWQIAFDLYAESIFKAHFPAAEWQSERDVIIREIAMGQDDPNRVLIRHLWQTAVRTAPHRHPVIGYTDTFSALTHEDLVTFHQRHYTPCNTTLIIVGDIDLDAVRQHVTSVLSALPRPPRAPVFLPQEPPQATPRIAHFSAPHNLTRIAQAWTAPIFPHPDAAALQVLAHITGAGRTSRLHRNLVEENPLLLSVSAWYFDRGFWGISARLEPQQEEAAILALNHAIAALRNTTFTDAEVAQARRSMITSTMQAFTTMSGQAAHYGRLHHLTGNPAADRLLLEQIVAVTPEDVARVAKTWLQPQTITRVTVGPEAAPHTTTTPAAAEDIAKTQRLILPNGVTLLLRPNRRLPFVYIAAALKGGLLSENQGQAGITTLMSELLTRGTHTRSRDDIAQTIESRGASLSTFAGFNAFGITAQGLSSDAEALLELIADILTNPTFPDDELERQRTRQIAAIRQSQEQPLSQAMQQLRDMLFPGHPYQNGPNGREEHVAGLTRADLVAHHERLTTTSNLVIAIFGDFDLQRIPAQLADALAGIKTGPEPEIDYAHPQPHPTIQSNQQFAPRQQAIVINGFPGVDMFDPDADALNLLQTALSGMASTLFNEIREKRGLAYFTGATQQTGLHPGFFALYAGTQPNATTEVEQLIQTEINRIRENGISPEEFSRARAQLLASHDMQLQNQLNMAMNAALHERYGLGAEYPFSLPQRIQTISLEQIQTITKRIFQDHVRKSAMLLPQPPPLDPGAVGQQPVE